MRYIGSGRTRTREQAANSVRSYEGEWIEKGCGLFAVELLDRNELIGFTGFSVPSFLPEIMPAVELGWRLARREWGRGYATEAARAVLEFGLSHVRLSQIVSIYQVGNHASARIVEKLGMHFDRETTDPSCGRPVRVYRFSASEVNNRV
jgi:RimJ/RimL family protein N-acetyltransferase